MVKGLPAKKEPTPSVSHSKGRLWYFWVSDGLPKQNRSNMTDIQPETKVMSSELEFQQMSGERKKNELEDEDKERAKVKECVSSFNLIEQGKMYVKKECSDE